MTPLELQFNILKSEYPDSTMEKLPSSAALITMANFQLPTGWSSKTTVVRFLAPVGYPFAKPDCFWIEEHVRLHSNAMPQNSGFNELPEVPGKYLWFSWHIENWNPNRDSLMTYVHVIEARLKTAV